MTWWFWIILGLVLIVAEMLTPGGFYLMFFGASALVVGFLTLAGLGGPEWVQWLLFSVFSVLSIAFLRKPLVAKFSAQGLGPDAPAVDTDSLVGEVAVASEPIAAGAIGRVELRGSAWSALNRGTQAIVAGQRCVVESISGLRLDVHPQ